MICRDPFVYYPVANPHQSYATGFCTSSSGKHCHTISNLQMVAQTHPTGTVFSSVQNFVISSSDRPFVSGISQPTRMTVNKALALKNQKVPSDPIRFCMMGNSWLP